MMPGRKNAQKPSRKAKVVGDASPGAAFPEIVWEKPMAKSDTGRTDEKKIQESLSRLLKDCIFKSNRRTLFPIFPVRTRSSLSFFQRHATFCSI